MNNVQRLQQPPYMHNTSQKGPDIAQTGDDTPGDSQKSIQRFEREIRLVHDGTWHLHEHIYEDRTYSEIIPGGWYDPLFRVRAFKLIHGTTNLFAVFVYDTPWSRGVVSPWACGIPIPGQITRIWTGDANNTQGSLLEPFMISLLG